MLGAASVYLFGAEPGKLPAQLYDVLARTTDDATRARLAAALARCWAYAGQPARGVRFADEAVERARAGRRPRSCWPTASTPRWPRTGVPTSSSVRRVLAARLDDVAAHVLDPDARLQAHLWGLQVACEALDVQAIHRQMRALELLGRGVTARAVLRRVAAADARPAARPHRHRRPAHRRRRGGGRAGRRSPTPGWCSRRWTPTRRPSPATPTTCAAGAAECEAFALAEGVTAVCAEAAFLWTCAGRLGPRPHPGAHLPRPGPRRPAPRRELAADPAVRPRSRAGRRGPRGRRDAARLLAPYEGRAVINAGAVMFHGVTDDTLARAAAAARRPDTAARLRPARWPPTNGSAPSGGATGSTSWRHRRPTNTPSRIGCTCTRCPAGSGSSGADAVPLRPLRGFGYLRELLRRPHQPVAALDLVGAGTGVAASPASATSLDQQALAAYRQRLAELDQELAEAEDWSDSAGWTALRAERDALLDEIARATGLDGRARTTGSSQERARIAVQKAISAAIDRIATIDEPLARHLRTTIHTGLTCSYEPDPTRPNWLLD